MSDTELHNKISNIDLRTNWFTPMQVLTILVVVCGCLATYFERDRVEVVDNTKQLTAITQSILTLKDSLTLFKSQMNSQMNYNHIVTSNRLDIIEDKVRHIRTVSYVPKLVAGYTQSYVNGKRTYKPVEK